jgi:hypothetical protein
MDTDGLKSTWQDHIIDKNDNKYKDSKYDEKIDILTNRLLQRECYKDYYTKINIKNILIKYIKDLELYE